MQSSQPCLCGVGHGSRLVCSHILLAPFALGNPRVVLEIKLLDCLVVGGHVHQIEHVIVVAVFDIIVMPVLVLYRLTIPLAL